MAESLYFRQAHDWLNETADRARRGEVPLEHAVRILRQFGFQADNLGQHALAVAEDLEQWRGQGDPKNLPAIPAPGPCPSRPPRWGNA